MAGEIGLIEGKQDIEGIAVGGSYSVMQDMMISVVDVMNLGDPNQIPNPNPVIPEPSTMILFGTGLAGLIGYRWRRNKQ